MASKKTILFTDESEEDLGAIRASLLARMPLQTEISEADIVRHALRETAERARVANGNPPGSKASRRSRKAARS